MFNSLVRELGTKMRLNYGKGASAIQVSCKPGLVGKLATRYQTLYFSSLQTVTAVTAIPSHAILSILVSNSDYIKYYCLWTLTTEKLEEPNHIHRRTLAAQCSLK